jgi:hypothetical protein
MDEDRFFESEVQEGRRVRSFQPHRALLTAAVVFALAWLVWPIFDELGFHFSTEELVELGTAEALPADKPLPVDKHVRLTGVLGNKAASIAGAFRPGSYRRGPVQLRQVLGSPIFVEFDQDTYKDRYRAFSRVTVDGRLADFGPESELKAVRQYFWDRYGMAIPEDARVLIVDERPGEMWRYPLLLAFALFAAAGSIFFLLRSLRHEVVPDEAPGGAA